MGIVKGQPHTGVTAAAYKDLLPRRLPGIASLTACLPLPHRTISEKALIMRDYGGEEGIRTLDTSYPRITV